MVEDKADCGEVPPEDDGSDPSWQRTSGKLPAGFLTARVPASKDASTEQWVRVRSSGEVELLRVVDRKTGHFERRRAGRVEGVVDNPVRAAWMRLRGGDRADIYLLRGPRKGYGKLPLEVVTDVALGPWEPLPIEQTWRAVAVQKDMAICWSAAHAKQRPSGEWLEDVRGSLEPGDAVHGPYYDGISNCALLVRDLTRATCDSYFSAAGSFGSRGVVRAGIGASGDVLDDKWSANQIALLRGGGFVSPGGLYGAGGIFLGSHAVKLASAASIPDRRGAGLWSINADDGSGKGPGVALVAATTKVFYAPGAAKVAQPYSAAHALAGGGLWVTVDTGSSKAPYVLDDSGTFTAVDTTVSGATAPSFHARLADGTFCGTYSDSGGKHVFCRDKGGAVTRTAHDGEGRWFLMDRGVIVIVGSTTVSSLDPETMTVKTLGAAPTRAVFTDATRALTGDEIYARTFAGSGVATIVRVSAAGAVTPLTLFGGQKVSCLGHTADNVGAVVPDRDVLVMRNRGGAVFRLPRPKP